MKKLISLALIIAMLTTMLFTFAACTKNEDAEETALEVKKTTITQAVYSYFNITMDVPLGEVEDTENPGTMIEGPLYKFQTTKPENCKFTADYYVVTNNALIGFDLDEISSITSYAWYKEQYGTQTMTFQLYKDEIINNSNYSGTYKPEMITTFAQRDAFKVDYKFTENGTNVKYGEYYTVSLDDFADKYKSGVMKVYITDVNSDSANVESVLADQEVNDLLNSIRFIAQ